jgi:hypothetical protein
MITDPSLGSVTVVKTMSGEIHREMHHDHERPRAGGEGDPEFSRESVADS